jgi:hypothetical protein
MSKPTTRPRRLFRSRSRSVPEVVSRELRGDMLRLARQPALPRVDAWIAANRSQFKPGTIAQVIAQHDPGCRYPDGGPCSCLTGPLIRTEGLEPANN